MRAPRRLRRLRSRAALVTLAVFGTCLPACSDDTDAPPPQATVEENCDAPVGACDLERCAPSASEARHVEVCSSIAWPTNPPTSGQHYPIWAAFSVFDAPVPRGFWLHSVEHSAVVLAYNCELYEGDCDALIDTLVAFKAGRDDDPLCDAAVGNRVIVTPDPLLAVPFAAVAWGHSLKATCFDEDAVTTFVDAHYGQNYENFCSGGVDPTDPDEGFDPNCGLAP